MTPNKPMRPIRETKYLVGEEPATIGKRQRARGAEADDRMAPEARAAERIRAQEGAEGMITQQCIVNCVAIVAYAFICWVIWKKF